MHFSEPIFGEVMPNQKGAKRKLSTVRDKIPCPVPSCDLKTERQNLKHHYKTFLIVDKHKNLLPLKDTQVLANIRKFNHQKFFIENGYTLENLSPDDSNSPDRKQRKLNCYFTLVPQSNDDPDDPPPLDNDEETIEVGGDSNEKTEEAVTSDEEESKAKNKPEKKTEREFSSGNTDRDRR